MNGVQKTLNIREYNRNYGRVLRRVIKINKKTGRPSGADPKKIFLILNVLKKYPEGIWFRRISMETRIPTSTVFYYLENVLEPFIENIGYKNDNKRFIGVRIIRLKPEKQNISLNDILRYLEIKRNIKAL